MLENVKNIAAVVAEFSELIAVVVIVIGEAPVDFVCSQSVRPD